MKQESGRSLIEVIGVLAITGLMTVSAMGIYRTIRANQVRTIAGEELEQIASNTKLLMEMAGSYEGISVDYLIKAGALPHSRFASTARPTTTGSLVMVFSLRFIVIRPCMIIFARSIIA